ncbi:MAG: hypothetical protein V1856_02030 [Candidatus Liptonbacteria bacterium]
MPDQFVPEVKPQIQEQDIHGVAAELKRHQESPEMRGVSGPELVRQSIRSYTGVQSAAPTAQAQRTDDSVLPKYAKDASSETKLEIETLLGMAFREGIVKATQQAVKSNPYILDTFHDALAGNLYEELKKRGMVG